ncbi:alpha/beta fold hydrolase [Serinicoccus kebangsaanensis]|uniref:alpha/beta fold hydrolase n=1 Tax=Serinicoccus kebangsaanensis TaxID=2602069 RepID=UPI00124F6F08|nr:alpha/beta fold hydrolase [Serinicoccus kebangsaanensis]
MSEQTTRPLAQTVIGEGEGRPVVFCHGLLGRGRNFTGIAKALQPEFRCVLLDMPDHGRSPWTDRIDYATAADLLVQQLRVLAVDGPVHLVGHSMGGKTAMTAALAAPDLVDRLVVVDISPTGSGEVSQFEHLLSALLELDLGAITSHGQADRMLATAVDSPALRGFLLQNLRRDPATQAFGWQPNLEVLLRDLDVVTGDIPHQDRTFEGPVLWIAGGDSPYIATEHEGPMRALFPRTVQVTVKGAGHWVHSEQPDAFTATLRHFLRHS